MCPMKKWLIKINDFAKVTVQTLESACKPGLFLVRENEVKQIYRYNKLINAVNNYKVNPIFRFVIILK